MAETATAIAEAMQIIFIMMVVIGCVEGGWCVCTVHAADQGIGNTVRSDGKNRLGSY